MINKKVELKRIIFKKLLGRFDYNIELKDKLTILTGPNGFGKSTILKTIEAISRGVEGISYFNSLNFEEIIFDFKNYENIRIRKENKTMYINNTNSLNKNLELMKSIINNGEIKIEKKDYSKILNNLENKKIKLQRAWLNELLTDEELRKLQNEINDQITLIEKEKNDYNLIVENSKKQKNISGIMSNFENLYTKMSNNEKIEFLNTIIKEIKIEVITKKINVINKYEITISDIIFR